MGSIISTIIVSAILVVIVGLIIFSMVKSKKKGKSLQCGGDCSKCRGCH